MQKTEELVGPYELVDFFLHGMLRYGAGPRKILFLAEHAFGSRYDEATLRQWLRVVPAPLLRPAVEALGDARRAEGRLGEPLAARRLAHAERRDRGRVAARARRRGGRVIRAVLLAASDLAPELGGTVLYRRNVERLPAAGAEAVRRLADAGRLDVVVIDSALPGAAAVVAALRQDPTTRATAIVALGRSEFGFDHLALLEAGANAILPLPPGQDWDDRLMRLIHVPVRKTSRFPVNLSLQGGLRDGAQLRGARGQPERPRPAARVPPPAQGGRGRAPALRDAEGPRAGRGDAARSCARRTPTASAWS